MLEDPNLIIQRITVSILPLLFAITLHEVAHGWAARRLGDNTAYMMGRITLNPIKHIDPIGTVLLPLLTLILTPFVFGWAKPVPVNWRYLKNPRRDMALVAVAGPAANLLMAILWAIVAKLAWFMAVSFNMPSLEFFFLMGQAGIIINCVLCVLNLLPILPLDGGRILYSLMPPRLAHQYGELEPYGLIILIVLLATGILGLILGPIVGFLYHLIAFMVSG